jgi:transposase-like protein
VLASIVMVWPSAREATEDELRQLARELYRRGKPMRVIAAELAVNRHQVGMWCGDIARPSGRGHPLPDTVKAEILRLIEDGAKYDTVAARLGVAQSTVSRTIQAHRQHQQAA